MGHMNIDTLEHSSILDKLNELCDTLGFHSLFKVSTCKMKSSSSSIDLILINCRYHYKDTHAFDKIVVTCFKNTYERLQPINIQYRSYKNFDRDAFLSDLQAVSFG